MREQLRKFNIYKYWLVVDKEETIVLLLNSCVCDLLLGSKFEFVQTLVQVKFHLETFFDICDDFDFLNDYATAKDKGANLKFDSG